MCTCKDCLSFNVCAIKKNYYANKPFKNGKIDKEKLIYQNNIENICKHFKDNAHYYLLSFPIGSEVFVVRSLTSNESNFYIFEDHVRGYGYNDFGLYITFFNHIAECHLDRIFTSRLEAESKLKELNNNEL